MIQIGSPSATIDSPIEHLVACHRRIEQRLDTLVNAANHLESDRSSALSAISKSFHFLDTSGVIHTQDEEVSLFPRLRPRISVGEIEFLNTLEAQHDEAERIYAELKQRTADHDIAKYRARAERLRSLYRDHISLEDRILTAIAKRALDDLEIAAISREMRGRRMH